MIFTLEVWIVFPEIFFEVSICCFFVWVSNAQRLSENNLPRRCRCVVPTVRLCSKTIWWLLFTIFNVGFLLNYWLNSIKNFFKKKRFSLEIFCWCLSSLHRNSRGSNQLMTVYSKCFSQNSNLLSPKTTGLFSSTDVLNYCQQASKREFIHKSFAFRPLRRNLIRWNLAETAFTYGYPW